MLRDSTPRNVGRSVGWSVGRSVGRSITLSFFSLFYVVLGHFKSLYILTFSLDEITRGVDLVSLSLSSAPSSSRSKDSSKGCVNHSVGPLVR